MIREAQHIAKESVEKYRKLEKEAAKQKIIYDA